MVGPVERWLCLLEQAKIARPNKDVINLAVRVMTRRLDMVQDADQAVELYNDVKRIWGSTTKGQLAILLNLRINGPMSDMCPYLLSAVNPHTGKGMVVKVLEDDNEAAVAKALMEGMPHGVRLVPTEAHKLHLDPKQTRAQHACRVYDVLVMPRFTFSLAVSMELMPDIILAEGRKLEDAIEYIHKKGYVHMDVKGNNVLVDESGSWWLGDFGSAVHVGTQVKTTTNWFMPFKLSRDPAQRPMADPKYDWHMLAVMLLCELYTEDQWQKALMEDGCCPAHKLLTAIKHVEHKELAEFLATLVERSTT